MISLRLLYLRHAYLFFFFFPSNAWASMCSYIFLFLCIDFHVPIIFPILLHNSCLYYKTIGERSYFELRVFICGNERHAFVYFQCRSSKCMWRVRDLDHGVMKIFSRAQCKNKFNSLLQARLRCPMGHVITQKPRNISGIRARCKL